MSTTLRLSGAVVDLQARTVTREGKTTSLAAKEAEVLAFLSRTDGPVSRDVLLAEVWGYSPKAVTRTVDQTVRRLRAKVEADPTNPVHVVTVYGAGYQFVGGGLEDDPGFVGRTEALERLRSLCETHRLVTVIGPGGMGKTRLVRHFAPAAFVDVSEAVSRDGILDAAAAALDVPLGDEPVAQLARAFASRGLVVLDNLEQVAGDAAALIAGLLAADPGVRLLTTSRHRLGLPDEAVLPLPPLPGPDAVALLLERARRLDPDFDADAEVLDALVARLDGLPLALELAAARANLLPADKLLARLERGQDASLAGVLDSSWALLTEPERRGLASCAVFRGGFDLEAAEAIGLSLDDVQSLLDKSLLRSERGRLSLLNHVRDYADSHLDAELRAQVEAAHAAWYLAIDDVERERDNLLAIWRRRPDEEAVRAILLLDPLLTRRGPPDVHRRLLEAALARDVSDALRLRLRLARGELLRLSGHPKEALDDLVAAEVLWPSRSKVAQSMACARMGDPTRGLEHALAAVEAAETDTDRALAHRQVAITLLEADENLEAEGHLLQAQLAAERSGEVARSDMTMWMATVKANTGRRAEAVLLFEEALDYARAARDRRQEGKLLSLLAMHYGDAGRLDDAALFGELAVEHHRALGQRGEEAIALGNLGFVLIELGRRDDAVRTLLAAQDIHRRAGLKRGVGITAGNLGILWFTEGEMHKARRDFRESLQTLAGISRRAEGYFGSFLAMTEACLGELDAADAALTAATAHLGDAGDPSGLELLALAGAFASWARGDVDEARRVLDTIAGDDTGDVRHAVRQLRKRLTASGGTGTAS